MIEELLDATVPVEVGDGYRCLLITDEQATLAEAEKDEGWKAAMAEELGSIEANQTWCLTELPPGK